MARKSRRVLPFRVPFFRIFYSTTYTLLYALTLCILAITPTSIVWTAVEARAYQYIFMLGGVYVLVATLTLFIYFSRLYTNRTVLAGVGKPYIPVEEGEVGRNVRKMVVRQLERSAIVGWEATPRDLYGEIWETEREGLLPADTGRNEWTVGRIIQIDPAVPPWGMVQHAGWSSPSRREDNGYPDVQFANVIAELPNLVEAQAVSLAPPDPTMTPRDGHTVADPTVVELLRRPATMGMRDYITQLSYLALINPPQLTQTFLRQYEHARFCGRPCTEFEFADLMATFSELLAGMTELDSSIIEQIRAQTADRTSTIDVNEASPPQSRASSTAHYKTPSPAPRRVYSPASSLLSPVTARETVLRNATPYMQQEDPSETVSRNATPYMQHEDPSFASFSSVIHNVPHGNETGADAFQQRNVSSSSLDSRSLASFTSDAGSVIRHSQG